MTIHSPFLRYLFAGLSAAICTGCFGVEQVEIEPPLPALVIDDFDDDVDNTVRQPTELAFLPWRCFSDVPRVVGCDTGPGRDDSRGRTMNFELFDVVDGQPDYQWMKLSTRSEQPLDFGAYERITFSARFHPAPEWKEPKLNLSLQLSCSSVGSDAWVEASVYVVRDSAWHTYQRDLRAFQQAQWIKDEWQAAHQRLIEPGECVAQVDEFGILISPEIGDGAEARGELIVDEIYVE